MKRLLSSILILALAVMLVSCTQTDGADGKSGGDNEEFYLIGEVTNVGAHIEVNVIEGEHAYGIYWVLISSQTEVFDKDGNEISVQNIKIGDKVRVVYGGQVMMSYPPQISAIKVTVQ